MLVKNCVVRLFLVASIILLFYGFKVVAVPDSCEQVTEPFCDKMWDKDHLGNVNLPGIGAFELGSYPGSSESMSYILDLKARVASWPKWPDSVRSRSKVAIDKLKVHIDHPAYDSLWTAKLHELSSDVNRIIDQVVYEKFYQERPELKKTHRERMRFSDIQRENEIQFEIENAILEAKYKNHPNWLAMGALFEQVRKDLKEEIQSWPVDREVINPILMKLDKVKLMLPYRDPRKVGVSAGCGTWEINAMYLSDKNIITICAGWFNTLKGESPTYAVLAHELTHSFDPDRLIFEDFEKSPQGRVAESLCHYDSSDISCTEWSDLKKNIFTSVKVTEVERPFTKILSCLKATKDLKPFDGQKVLDRGNYFMGFDWSGAASSHSLSLLAEHRSLRQGLEVKNEYFLNPVKLRSTSTGYFEVKQKCGPGIRNEALVQELKCLDYKSNDPKRSEIFKKANDEARKVEQNLFEHYLSKCGRFCDSLVPIGLSVNVDEDFADWVASQLFSRFLAREKSLEKRRELASVARIVNCRKAGITAYAPDLLKTEKAYSYEPHPDDKSRRLGLFTSKIQQQLNCKLEQQVAPNCSF